MVFSIFNRTVPDTFRGHVTFKPQLMRYSGDGTPYASGEQSYVWEAAGCKAADWDWWMLMYSSGSTGPFVLPTDDSQRGSYSFTSGRLYRPTFERCEGGVYLGIHIEMHFLIPLQTP